jgi:cytoskeleton protein RodZ
VSVGADVAAARRASGLTVDDVSAATCVRATVLRHIEDDDFTLCGGDVYARGHLRAICTVVGLDAEPLLAAFAREQGTEEPAEQALAMASPSAAEAYHAPRQVNWSAMLAVALVGVLGFVGFRFLTVGQEAESASSRPPVAAAPESSPPPSAADQAPTSAPSSEQAGTATEPPDAALPPEAVAAGPAVQMVLSTDQGRSWVQVTGSDGVLFSGVIEKGISRRFVDSEKVAVVIGNAGAVSLRVNGEDLGSAGESGQVARLTFGPGNPNQG